MSRFERMIRGKTIALVGNAITTDGSGLGARVDSHNIVVRFNVHAYPVKAEEFDNIGTKTNVMYFDRAQYAEYVSDGFYIYNEDMIPSFTIPSPAQFEIAKQYCGLTGTWGNYAAASGVSMLYLCCVWGASEIFMTGFDFFRTQSRYGDPLYNRKRKGPYQIDPPINTFDEFFNWPGYSDKDLDEAITRELCIEYNIKLDEPLRRIIYG